MFSRMNYFTVSIKIQGQNGEAIKEVSAPLPNDASQNAALKVQEISK